MFIFIIYMNVSRIYAKASDILNTDITPNNKLTLFSIHWVHACKTRFIIYKKYIFRVIYLR